MMQKRAQQEWVLSVHAAKSHLGRGRTALKEKECQSALVWSEGHHLQGNADAERAKTRRRAKRIKKKKRSTGCRCGMNKKGSLKSCTDIEGQRKTKCPCFRNGSACNSNLFFFCKRCKNTFSQFQALETEVTKGATTKGKRHSSYMRVRGEEFLQASDSEASQGPWTKLEGCMLQTI